MEKHSLSSKIISLILSILMTFMLVPSSSWSLIAYAGSEEEGGTRQQPVNFVTPITDPRYGEEEKGDLSVRDTDPAEILAEDPEGRDRFQKTYKLEDRTNLMLVFPEAVHYRNGEQWESIDNTLVPSEKEGYLQNKAGAWTICLPAFMDEEHPVVIEKNGYALTMRLLDEILPEKQTEVIPETDQSVPFPESETETDSGEEPVIPAAQEAPPKDEESAEGAQPDAVPEAPDTERTDEAAGQEAAGTDGIPETDTGEDQPEDMPEAELNLPADTPEEEQDTDSHSQNETPDGETPPESLEPHRLVPVSSKAVIENPDQKKKDDGNDPYLAEAMRAMLDSSALYSDVFPGIDVRYDLISERLKESLVLRERPKKPLHSDSVSPLKT